MLTTVIVDDEPRTRKSILDMLELYCPEVQVLGSADSVQSGVEMVLKYRPQLLFLDVKMPDGTGFDLLDQVELPHTRVVFVSAYEEFAFNAFQVKAVHYLLKPIDPELLIGVVKSTSEELEKETLNGHLKSLFENIGSPAANPKKIILKTAEHIFPIETKDIVRCESDGNYTRFYVIGGKSILVAKTLGYYEGELIPEGYFRVHRSHLINLNQVVSLDKRNGGFVLMKDGSSVPIASRKREQLLEVLGISGQGG